MALDITGDLEILGGDALRRYKAREEAYEAMRAALELAKPVLADRAVGGRQLRSAAEAKEAWEAVDRALALAEQAGG